VDLGVVFRALKLIPDYLAPKRTRKATEKTHGRERECVLPRRDEGGRVGGCPAARMDSLPHLSSRLSRDDERDTPVNRKEVEIEEARIKKLD